MTGVRPVKSAGSGLSGPELRLATQSGVRARSRGHQSGICPACTRKPARQGCKLAGQRRIEWARLVAERQQGTTERLKPPATLRAS